MELLKPKSETVPEAHLFHGSRALIVDDDKTICAILSNFLEILGMKCSWTSEPLQAAESIHAQEYDVIISDIYMPDLTGHELVEISLQYSPLTPVILMTGRPTLENTIEAIRLGAYDYLIKPFNMDAVVVILSRALRYRRLAVENRAYQQDLELKVQERTRELSNFLFHSVQSLSLALEARDPYTQGHGARVGDLVICMAKELGVPEKEHQVLRLAAQLHDIGKIGVPDTILLKKEKLTPIEFDIMKDHVYIGYRILSPIPSLKEVSCYIYEHHERLDGKGYPRGLKGDEIHFNSRLLEVSEVCDALATERCYKAAWPLEDIVSFFEENSGAAFDPEVVKALSSILRREGDDILTNLRRGFL